MNINQNIPSIANRPLSDMDSGGVYFEEEVCQYSGLPSVTTYIEKEEDEIILDHT
jgi:hypothetical protein